MKMRPLKNKRYRPAYRHPYNFLVPIIERVKLSVVSIKTSKAYRNPSYSSFPFGRRPYERESSEERNNIGSGFVIDPRGYILTSHHVIEGAEDILVRFFNSKEYKAQVVMSDERRDIAVLKVSSQRPLRPLTIGSSKKSRLGEFVISIGNPMGLEHSITTGIISAKNRNILRGRMMYGDIIQTDCAINPGNSGGPLINLNGEVIGMIAFIAKYNQGLGFSIGIDSIADSVGDYLKR